MNGWYAIAIVAAFVVMLEFKNRQIIDLLMDEIDDAKRAEGRYTRREPARTSYTPKPIRNRFQFTEADYKRLKETGHASGKWNGGEKA